MLLVLLLACGHPDAAVVSGPPVVPMTAPDEAKVWIARAEVAAALHDDVERDRALAWVERLDGRSPWAWMAIARVWLNAGQPERAREALVRARALGEVPGLAELEAEAR